jgi:hypothetical protein
VGAWNINGQTVYTTGAVGMISTTDDSQHWRFIPDDHPTNFYSLEFIRCRWPESPESWNLDIGPTLMSPQSEFLNPDWTSHVTYLQLGLEDPPEDNPENDAIPGLHSEIGYWRETFRNYLTNYQRVYDMGTNVLGAATNPIVSILTVSNTAIGLQSANATVGGYTFEIDCVLLDYSTGADFTPGSQLPIHQPVAPSVTCTRLAAEPGNGKLKLDWTTTTNLGITGFHIERSPTGGGSYTPIAGTDISTRTYIDTNLTIGSTYVYRVSATNWAYVMPSTESSNSAYYIHPAPPPERVRNLTLR